MNERMTLAAQLEAHIAQHAALRFSWPRHNCCHFVAGWVHATTGLDPMRGQPVTHDRLAAWRLIRRLGGSMAGALSRQLGRMPIAAAQAQTGDIVLVHLDEAGDSAAAGICNGRHVALLTEDEGVTMVPMTAARMAWRLHGEDAQA